MEVIVNVVAFVAIALWLWYLALQSRLLRGQGIAHRRVVRSGGRRMEIMDMLNKVVAIGLSAFSIILWGCCGDADHRRDDHH